MRKELEKEIRLEKEIEESEKEAQNRSKLQEERIR